MKLDLATRHFGAGGLKPGSRAQGATRRLVFSALRHFLDLSAGHFNGPAQSVGSLETRSKNSS